MHNCRVVRECHRCLDLLSESFSVSLVWASGHSNMPEKCRADQLGRDRTLLPESSAKFVNARKFFRDTNLSWTNEEFRSTAIQTWPSKLLLRLYHSGHAYKLLCNVKTRKECNSHLTTSAVATGPQRKRRLSYTSSVNDHLLLGSAILISLTELSFIDVNYIVFIDGIKATTPTYLSTYLTETTTTTE